MLNIIIPLGGKGERFSKSGYQKSKPLIKVLGKEIIFWTIDCLNIEFIRNIYIPYNSKLVEYNFDQILVNRYPNINFKFLPLKSQTSGASESILKIIEIINENEKKYPFICLDGDNFYLTDVISIYLKNSKNNAIFTIEDKYSNSDCFSFLQIDDNNRILRIEEKKKINNYINTGCYCFQNGEILFDACRYVVENYSTQECYLSQTITYLLNKGFEFYSNIIPIDDWICLGTPLQIKMFCNSLPMKKATEKTKQNLLIPTYRFCFDLDNTLVTSPRKKGDYTTVEPINSNIIFLNFLKKMGHTIIIHTARRMKTHNGDINKVKMDIEIITIETLRKFNIEYDELIFGKPYADFYIDDLAINAYTNLQKEIGFYESFIETRSFHSLDFSNPNTLIKKGEDLSNEIYWYTMMPNSIKDIFPLLFNHDQNYRWYELELIHGITISKMYVEKDLSIDTFKSVLQSVDRIHQSQIIENNDQIMIIDIYSNYVCKLKQRFKNHKKIYDLLDNSESVYNRLVILLQEYQLKNLGEKCIIHGDPVFTNILINNFGKIKMIDMRGYQTTSEGHNINTLYGDKFYDYSKIYQSLIGYDEILLNICINDESYKTSMIYFFENYIKIKFDEDRLKWIKIITSSLLFSLIPLHKDSNKILKYFEICKKLLI
jgi:capsule biosynthesis phosphatase